MKKILICGASGFIGKNLVEHFSKSFDVRAVDLKIEDTKNNKNIEYIQGDLTNKEFVKDIVKGVDAILQYAAVSTGIKDAIEKPYLHVTDNVVMNALLMREAFEQKVKHFIFPSCTVMYQPSKKLLKEEDFAGTIDENSTYYGGGNMKVFNENMCRFYSKIGNTKFTVIRQSNIYGPYDKFQLEKSHVFAATITKVMQANNEISVWGDGSETKDFLYIKDLTNFIENVLNKQNTPFELINLGSSSSTSIKDLVKNIIKISGKNLKINYDLTKPTRKVSVKIDSGQASNKFNWSPKVSLEEGISKTINWYKKKIK